jgi:hypothetical protein
VLLRLYLTVCAIFAAVSFGDLSPARADIEIVTLPYSVGGTPCPTCLLYEVQISGLINGNDPAAFIVAANDSRLSGKGTNSGPRPPRILLKSLGGSVPAAIMLGELIRKNGYATWVSEQDQCSSACVLVLAAGVQRKPWGRIGIHRPRFDEAVFAQLSHNDARAKYEEMAGRVRDYLDRMGMDSALYLAMLKVPSDDVRILSPQELRAYGLEGEDAAWAEWSRAKGIEKDGLQHHISRKVLIAVLDARCSVPSDYCVRTVEAEVLKELKLCADKTDAEHIACARRVERRLIQR